jgi:hypothetical protein
MIIILNTTLQKSISVKPSKTGLCIALLCYEKSSSKKNVFVSLKKYDDNLGFKISSAAITIFALFIGVILFHY